MPETRAGAPGKVILFGEHAVVYGRPAIAAPVTQVRAIAVVEDRETEGLRLMAPDLGLERWLDETKMEDPFARSVQVLLDAAGLKVAPNLCVTVRSTIPIASGLGSGAAMAAAVIRSLARHLGRPDLATDVQVSAMTYEVERLLHGTPSGIDNTVVSFEQPVFFMRQQPENLIETLSVATPIRLLVADTGVASMTKAVVGDVRTAWQANKGRYEVFFEGCGRVALAAREAIETGAMLRMGELMAQNQAYLRKMGVSSAELDRLIEAALAAGAIGAKLSGAGRGGNMIALVDEARESTVREALLSTGARQVLSSIIT